MMSEITADTYQTSMLFQKALSRANGPIDAEHIAYVIALATADDVIDELQEQAEQDFLLLMLIDEIRRKKPEARSLKNIYDLLNQDDTGAVELILRMSEFWKKAANDEFRQLAVAGLKDRPVEVLMADDPEFEEAPD
jgi:hypothetical protein